MRKPERIEQITAELKALWLKNSELRLGQLLENNVFTKGERGDKTSVAMFYQEDNVTLQLLQESNAKATHKILHG